MTNHVKGRIKELFNHRYDSLMLPSHSNSDSVVDFNSGTKDVFCTLPASKSVYLDSTGTPVGAASAGFALAMAVAL